MALKACKECGAMISSVAITCPSCGKKRPTGGTSLSVKLIIAIFGLLVLGQLINAFHGGSQNVPPAIATVSPEQDALSKTSVTMKWEKSGFDNVMLATLDIKNESNFKIKDFTITCTHFAKSGTKIDSNTRTIYDVIFPKSKKVFKKFNMGFIANQVESSSCEITDLKIAQ